MILLCALCVLLILAGLFIHLELFVLLGAALGALAIGSHLWVRLAIRGLTLHRVFPDRAFLGDEVAVHLVLENRSRLALPWLELRDEIPDGIRQQRLPAFALGLRGGERRPLGYTLLCHRRGLYTIHHAAVRAGGVLGMSHLTRSAGEPHELLVYPRIVPLDRARSAVRPHAPALAAPNSLFADPTHIVGVRDYLPGDSLRSVHWKASARLGHLAVKEYQPVASQEIVVALDLALPDYDPYLRHDAMETAIVVAASLSRLGITSGGLPTGLLLHDRTGTGILGPQGGDAHLTRILDALARAEWTQDRDFVPALEAAVGHLTRPATLLVILGAATDHLLRAVERLRRKGHDISTILVVPTEKRVFLPAATPCRIHTVWSDDELRALGTAL